MEMKVMEYSTPQMVVFDILFEGVVCSSNEWLDELEGEW